MESPRSSCAIANTPTEKKKSSAGSSTSRLRTYRVIGALSSHGPAAPLTDPNDRTILLAMATASRSVARRRAQSKGEQTREAILAHALGLATRIGFEGLSIGRLAEDLRMSKSGLFAHFRSKEALQLEILKMAGAGKGEEGGETGLTVH